MPRASFASPAAESESDQGRGKDDKMTTVRIRMRHMKRFCFFFFFHIPFLLCGTVVNPQYSNFLPPPHGEKIWHGGQKKLSASIISQRNVCSRLTASSSSFSLPRRRRRRGIGGLIRIFMGESRWGKGKEGVLVKNREVWLGTRMTMMIWRRSV